MQLMSLGMILKDKRNWVFYVSVIQKTGANIFQMSKKPIFRYSSKTIRHVVQVTLTKWDILENCHAESSTISQFSVVIGHRQEGKIALK